MSKARKYIVLYVTHYGKDWTEIYKEVCIDRDFMQEVKESHAMIPELIRVEFSDVEATIEEMKDMLTYNEFMNAKKMIALQKIEKAERMKLDEIKSCNPNLLND